MVRSSEKDKLQDSSIEQYKNEERAVLAKEFFC
jgi:hypothetical protein